MLGQTAAAVRWDAQPRERVVVPPDLAQCDPELGVDLRIMLASHGEFQRCDGLLRATLHQQGITQDVQRLGVAGIRLKYFAGNQLRVFGRWLFKASIAR